LTGAAIGPADRIGAETLETMQAAPRYNRWQYDRIAPFLGRRICEVGAGIGNISSLIRRAAPEVLVLVDTDPYYRQALQARFGVAPEVIIDELTLPDGTASDRFGKHRLDTVVALNVVEHIDQDVEALRCMAGMLAPGGRVVILVPALEGLFGSLDRELGHCRRYTRRSLSDRMRQAGFRVEQAFYFNLIGTLGWWYNARVRQVPRIPGWQVRWLERFVPVLRLEDHISLPFGQSVIAIGALDV